MSWLATVVVVCIGVLSSSACYPRVNPLVPGYTAPDDVARLARKCRRHSKTRCLFAADERRQAGEYEAAAFLYDAFTSRNNHFTSFGVAWGLLIGEPVFHDEDFALYFLGLQCAAADPRACAVIGLRYADQPGADRSWRDKLEFACNHEIELACARLARDNVEAHEPADDDLAVEADSGAAIGSAAIGSASVWVIAHWRSEVVPRALLIVIPRADQSPSSLAAFANRALDDRFIHAVVESTEPLTQQIELSTAIAYDKGLAHRPALDSGRPRTPTITALLIDVRNADEDEALVALRAGAAHAVQAAIVLSDAGERRREVVEHEWSDKLDVLTLPSPRDANDAATWAEVVGFIDEVAHARIREPAGNAQGM